MRFSKKIFWRATLSASMLATTISYAHAEALTVNYTMALAGLPIGSATLVLTPGSGTTSVALTGKAGGPIDLGRMNASAVVTAGQVTAQSQSGSGKNASAATLVSRGAPGSSSFSYTGQNNRGPGRIAMTLSGGQATAVEVSIPDNPQAVRVPVTAAHKSGVVDPLSVLGQIIQPGGTMKPQGACGKSHAVFSGQARFNLVGTASQPASVKGLPEGWSALSCRITYTPVAGHRIDKSSSAAEPRTANVIFAQSGDATKVVLWSLSVPGSFGSFSLTANAVR
jgi:hypothetical protein